MATRSPPRFVPTLTEVVQPPTTAPAPLAPQAPTSEPALSADQLAQRVLQRLDLTIDRRLREAIASVVLEQTKALGPLLRERVDAAVRQAVTQALAEELEARQRDTSPRA